MSLVPRNNWFDIEKAFGSFFEPSSLQARTSGVAAPKVDIRDKEDHFEITAELPGVKKEDVHVHLDNGVLTIETESNDEKTEEKDGVVIRRERYSGKMVRSFTLGPGVSEADIKAGFENGLLTLEVPKKSPELPKARRILID